MKTELTRKQAIEEGFSKAGYYGHDWQTAQDIEDFQDSELLERKICLFSKESNAPSITAEHIKGMIADEIEDRHSDETGDDTKQVWDKVTDLDFEPTAKMINEALSSYQCWTLTDIQLIP